MLKIGESKTIFLTFINNHKNIFLSFFFAFFNILWSTTLCSWNIKHVCKTHNRGYGTNRFKICPLLYIYINTINRFFYVN